MIQICLKVAAPQTRQPTGMDPEGQRTKHAVNVLLMTASKTNSRLVLGWLETIAVRRTKTRLRCPIRAAPQDPFRALHRAFRIGLTGMTVIVTPVPVIDPLLHVADHIQEAVRTCSVRHAAHGLNVTFVTDQQGRIEHSQVRVGISIPPREAKAARASRGLFPLRFGGQTCPRPSTIRIRFQPTDALDSSRRIVGGHLPVLRRGLTAASGHAGRIHLVRDLSLVDPIAGEIDHMGRHFIAPREGIVRTIAAHLEAA